MHLIFMFLQPWSADSNVPLVPLRASEGCKT